MKVTIKAVVCIYTVSEPVHVKGSTGLATKLEKYKRIFKQIKHIVYKTWFTEKARTGRQ
jgi:hypothetical protein